ncbi:hypothetical protein [Photorhabdus namnaonensis]|uniref:hypothetical protein n=1 Tax=Photorhabdus namnaonensis TaxID=1851568 RepID=UPI001969F280|nr:hypothetical protein [Photorhabdus namnaonensis]
MMAFFLIIKSKAHVRSTRTKNGLLSPDKSGFPVEGHIIYYREIPAGIEVLAVLHQTLE